MGVPAAGATISDDLDTVMTQAVANLRGLMLASETYRQTVGASVGLGATESLAVAYLAANGDSGQSDLARALRLTSSASTALVDRLERQGVAERKRHPSDRRRSIIGLTERGQAITTESSRLLRQSFGEPDVDALLTVSASLATIAGELNALSRQILSGTAAPVTTQALPAA